MFLNPILCFIIIILGIQTSPEISAEDVNFTNEMECTDKIPVLTLQCQLSDPTRVTTMYQIKIQQKNISELYEDVVIVIFKSPNISVVVWSNDTIEKISSTEGSSVFPANESRLKLQINLSSLRQESMKFRCTISAQGIVGDLKQDLAVRKADAGCPSFATGQKIQAEYANILVYILACTTLACSFTSLG